LQDHTRPQPPQAAAEEPHEAEAPRSLQNYGSAARYRNI